MAAPEILPASHSASGSEDLEFHDGHAAGTSLERDWHDPLDLHGLRVALGATGDDAIHRMHDHEIQVAVRRKLESGQLRAKKDLCDRKDETNRKFRAFIDAHRSDADKIAAVLNNRLENILGLSAHESDVGRSRFAVNGNNFFGLHSSSKHPLPNQKGIMPAAKDPNVGMAVYDSYVACAQSFAQTKGQLVVGVVDPKEFATILQKQGKFGIGPQGPLPDYVPNLVNIIGHIAKRLNCR